MADFFQTGAMATLHRLGDPGIERLEAQLQEFVKNMPVALVLPCHVREVGTPALRNIIRELDQVDYLQQVVVGLDGANASGWRKARAFFAKSRHRPAILWNDGPRMKRLQARLAAADLDAGSPGKGRNMWLCYGYVLASGQSRVIAAHDCDILTYNRELLARLCYPVANDSLGFDFCKGYTARFTHKLNGRVMRLMFTPLIRSLESIIGTHPFLNYMDTFRYPLAGEICVDLDVVRRTRMPSDWGVEVGMLAEVFRVTSPKAICQVEIGDRFDHKHQELSPRDATKGLNKMAIDIARCIFRTVAAEGVRMDSGLFDTLLSAYLRKAEDTIRFYHADAEINGLAFDRHQEEQAVATFVRGIRTAAQQFMENPLGEPLIPNWNRVESALPDFLHELQEAVEADNH
jgi:glucosyl-3-phosphoglycerate synthase